LKLHRIIALLAILLCPAQANASWITFANLLGGNQPLSDFDQMFGYVGAMGQEVCTATGANSIALTPAANQPTIVAYANNQLFGFTAAANSTGSITLNVNSVGALPAFAADGVTQLGSGSLNSGSYYLFVYNSTLNSGSGGFQLISSSVSSGNGTVNTGTSSQLAYYASNGNTVSGTSALPNGTTATTQAANDNSTKVATTAYVNNVSGSFTKGTSCTQNPVTSNTETSCAHGLGSTPTFFVAYLQCLTAEHGFNIGDIIPLPNGNLLSASPNWTVSGDATNTNISTYTAVGMVQIQKSGGADINLTNANWKLVVIPYVAN
jgi:hypothetical protein